MSSFRSGHTKAGVLCRVAFVVLCVGAAGAISSPVSASIPAGSGNGKSCTGSFSAEPTSMTANFPYRFELYCILNPGNFSAHDTAMLDLADAPESGTAAASQTQLTLIGTGGASNAQLYSQQSTPWELRHGVLVDGSGDQLAGATSNGGASLPTNAFRLIVTNWQANGTYTLSNRTAYLRHFTPYGMSEANFLALYCFSATDLNGQAQLCNGGASNDVGLSYAGVSPWPVRPDFFGATSPYNPTPCEGVNTTLVKNGTNVTEPITSATVAQGDLMQVRIAFPDGATGTQTARLDFIPDTSVPTGRRTLGTWPLPNNSPDVLVNVTASFQAFDAEAFPLSRTAVRCESEWGFGYDTFDGTDPWGATPLDGATPSADEDERTLSACFSGAGIGINPSSWVPATGRMMACVTAALFVPSDDYFTDTFSAISTDLESQFPVSMAYLGVDTLEDIGDEISSPSGTGCFGFGSIDLGSAGEVSAPTSCIGDGITIGSPQRSAVAVMMIGPLVLALAAHAFSVVRDK